MHERFTSKKRNQDYLDYVQSFDEALDYNKEIEPLIAKSSQVIMIVVIPVRKVCFQNFRDDV